MPSMVNAAGCQGAVDGERRPSKLQDVVVVHGQKVADMLGGVEFHTALEDAGVVVGGDQ
jgi:hypothetical protein